MKNEIVHARIDADVKTKSETILNRIGVSLSQAIDLFLRQVVLKKGFPFKLNDVEKEDEIIENEQLAYIFSSVDGREPSLEAKKIIHLYARGDIDLETAEFALFRKYQQ